MKFAGSSRGISIVMFAGPAPPARAFHAGASIGCKLYIFGGHVWVREKKGLLKFGSEGLWCLDTVSLDRVPRVYQSQHHAVQRCCGCAQKPIVGQSQEHAARH